MNAFVRWGKFNAVGAMGMALQLVLLAAFNRWLHGHYLYAATAAVEVTLLHNFVWHVQYTWRDREEGASTLRRLGRFHVSNGAVSLLGNLVLMRLLMQAAKLPLLPANVLAIVCCSAVNYWLGNCWTFATSPPPLERRTSSELRGRLR